MLKIPFPNFAVPQRI